MNSPTPATSARPAAPQQASPAPAAGTAGDLEELAAAVMRQLGREAPPAISPFPDAPPQAGRPDPPGPSVSITAADGDISGAVLVAGTAVGRGEAVVAAAVDDDICGAGVVRYAAAQARRRQVPLRVVHVWTGPDTAHDRGRMTRHERMSDADALLSGVLYGCLTAEQADATEREILHDSDAGRALLALSAEAALMVVAARSTPAPGGEPLGGTVRALLGRTACALAVLPAGRDAVRRLPR